MVGMPMRMVAAITHQEVASLDRTPGQGNVFRIDTGHPCGTFVTLLSGLSALSAPELNLFVAKLLQGMSCKIH